MPVSRAKNGDGDAAPASPAHFSPHFERVLSAWAGQWSTHGGRHYFAASILGEYVGGTVRPEDTREGTSA